jgi:hypothetical protein
MPKYEGYMVTTSDKEGKKYKATDEDGKEIHFGASGYRIKPGTDAGNSYCARSFGIKSDKYSANWWARQLWSCEGKKSVSDKPFFGKIEL